MRRRFFRKHPVWTALLTATLIVGMSVVWPVSQELVKAGSVVSLRVTDREGQLLREVRPEGRGLDVSLGDVPRIAVQALIATEDRNFYHHPGIDPVAIARAAWGNVTSGRITSGASTITMQVARAVRESAGRGWGAKLAEMHLALRLEVWLSKEEILELWLERAFFGNQTHGIESAARLYFGKSSGDLTPSEATFLVGLPQRPGAYDPFRYLDAARERQGVVLASLARERVITDAERDRLAELPVTILPPAGHFQAPHFVQWVVPDAPAGARELRTSLDLDLQRAIERNARTHLRRLRDENATNAAVVVLDNASGEVLAWVGSADFWNERTSGQNDGVRMLRQPGSALKPFTYALALASRRYTPASILADVELNVLEAGGAFSPDNYDERYHGPVPLAQALASSFNIPAVRLVQELGPDRLLQQLHRAGFASLDKPASFYGVGLTLGNGEVQLLELVRAYSGLARGGRLPEVRPTRWIRTESGDTLWSGAGGLSGVKVAAANGSDRPSDAVRRGSGDMGISPAVAYLITHILSDPEAREPGFGRGGPLELPFPAAVKTGTSKDYRDNWAVGYTPRHTVAVWVGNFDGRPMRWVSGVSGAAPLLNSTFRLLGSGGAFERPDGVVETEISPASGLLPGPDSPVRRTSLFLAGTVPTDTCHVHVRVAIDIRNGLRATDKTPDEYIQEELFLDHPPEFHAWMVAEGLPLPPPFEADMDATLPNEPSYSDALRVDYPESGTQYQMDPVLRADFQRIHLKGTAQPSVAGVSWWVDGKPLEAPFQRADWALAPGRHEIELRAVTFDGQRLRSRPSIITVFPVAEPVSDE